MGGLPEIPEFIRPGNEVGAQRPSEGTAVSVLSPLRSAKVPRYMAD